MKLPLINQNTVVNPDVDDAAQDQLTTWYTEHAVSFIHRHKDQPFFLYVPHAMVHVPLHVSDKFRGKTPRGLFGDVVEELDWSVGQILAALKEDGLDERTLVMFCSDNGPWLCFGDHAGSAYPLREGKGTSWDGGVREPTLMRWPGHIPAGRVCDAPLMTIDMLPTIARLIGAKLPPNKIDGLDISEVITGKTDQSPHDVLYFYYHKDDLEALRSGKWKLELARSYRSLNGRPGGKNGRPVPYVAAEDSAAGAVRPGRRPRPAPRRRRRAPGGVEEAAGGGRPDARRTGRRPDRSSRAPNVVRRGGSPTRTCSLPMPLFPRPSIRSTGPA